MAPLRQLHIWNQICLIPSSIVHNANRVVLKHYVKLFLQIFKIVALNVLSLVSKILILARKCKVGHLDNLTADFSHVWRDWVFPEWTFEKWNLLVAKVKRKFQFLLWLHSKSIRCYPWFGVERCRSILKWLYFVVIMPQIPTSEPQQKIQPTLTSLVTL